MKLNHQLIISFLLIGFLAIFNVNCTQKKKQLNIIIFVADDVGYGDLGSYGCTDIQTPNIDKLAKQGVRFTNFYTNGPECTPTRVALLTGRYQQRAGGLECALGAGNVGRYDEAIWLSEQKELGLPVSENSLVQTVKRVGYETAMFGKWHLGYEKKFRPNKQGFDYSFGPIGYGGDYFYHTEQVNHGLSDFTGMHTLAENGKEVDYTGEYFTDLISNKAVAWLQNRNKENPFLLYMPYTAPHSPYQGPNDKIERPLKADEWNLGSRETYIEMTEALDNGIGKILNYLTENELDEETLVIFVSDNGGTKFANNGIFSGFKGQVYEGGIHVPCIIRWPGKVQANSTSKQTCISMDLTKSVINLLDSENESLELDGYDILNHVIQNKPDFDRSLFWRAKRGDRIQKAIRDGDFKYLIRLDNDSISDEKLFNLKTDPSELNDLLKSSDEKAEELKTKLNEWEKDVKSPRLEVFENILR